MASVRKRTWKAGTETKTAWIADYFDQGGKRHLKTFPTKKAANVWLLTARHEVAQGVHVSEGNSMTVAEAAELWLQRGTLERLERSTMDKYRNHVNLRIVPALGAVKLAQLSPPMIAQFRDDLLGSVSWAMARKVLNSLKGILAEARRRGLVVQNVAADVKIKARRREERKLADRRDIPTKAEINAILAAATGRWRPLLITAVFTGLRSSELRGLTWNDVDLEDRMIHVRQRADQWGVIGSPKSQSGHREIPMSPLVFNTLREWKLSCPRVAVSNENSGHLWLVFPNGVGRIESHSNITHRGFEPTQIKAGVTQPHATEKDQAGKPVLTAKYGMHALRHFFASWAIEQGFTPKKAQELLGHSSIQMTFDTYGHLFLSTEDDHTKFAAAERLLLE